MMPVIANAVEPPMAATNEEHTAKIKNSKIRLGTLTVSCSALICLSNEAPSQYAKL